MSEYAQSSVHVRSEVAAPDDRERFEQLLAQHDRRLRRFAGGIVADRHRVDDVLQEAYLRAFTKLPRRFESHAHERAWLHRVVYRCCVDELRQARRSRAEPLPETLRATADPDARIDQAMRGLEPAQRAVM